MRKLKLVAIIIVTLLAIAITSFFSWYAVNVAISHIVWHAQNYEVRQVRVFEGEMAWSFDDLERRALRDPDWFPHVVQVLPSGFIYLGEVLEGMDDILEVFFWSTNIVFMDVENITFDRIFVRDNDNIVIYNNAYYVNVERIDEIIMMAADIFEQRNRIYAIGENMKIRGGIRGDTHRGQYSLEIRSVRRISDSRTYEISFSIYPAVSEADTLAFFQYASTRIGILPGRRLTNFILIDSETVMIEVDLFEHLDMVVLNIPRELGLRYRNSLRRVSVRNNESN